VRFVGQLSSDVAHLAGLTVRHQEFLDAEFVSAEMPLHLYQGFDGVLGLAPFDALNRTDLSIRPSIFKSMVREKLLSSNMFKLELPHGMHLIDGGRRDPGKLTFGQPSVRSSGQNVVKLPLAARSFSHQDWFSPGTDFDWNNGDLRLQIGPSYPIQISPAMRGIALPRPLATIINEQIALPRSSPGSIYEVDCGKRANLPLLVFTFEGKSDLRLDAFDYTFERGYSNGTTLDCHSLFFDTDNIPGYSIGSGVLEKYRTEWDLDAKEIRCKS